MRTIDYVVRSDMYGAQKSAVPGDQQVYVIPASGDQEISLNLRQIDLQSYTRQGRDLEILLADGRIIVLEGYFGDDGTAQSRLFISADGYLNEVTLVEGAEGSYYAQYGTTEVWGKWSPSDDLIFVEGSEVMPSGAGEEEVSMLAAAGLLGGSGLATAAGLGAAGLAASSLLGGGKGSGGGTGTDPDTDTGSGTGTGGGTRIEPSINEDDDVVVAGDDAGPGTSTITFTGWAEPGSQVFVTVGDIVIETVANDDGEWKVVFEDDTLPKDGNYTVVVKVVEKDGTETELEGPEVTIDTTPPETDVTEGTVSTGDITNAADYKDGIEISGTGEAGATLAVTIEGVTVNTVVTSTGTWSVMFNTTDLPDGEYTTDVKIVSKDAYGNTTVIHDSLAVDTEVRSFKFTSQTGGSDNVINAVEAQADLTVTGTTEPGSTVIVKLGGVEIPAVVDAKGNWTVTFKSSQIPKGTLETELVATTTDPAGNVKTIKQGVSIDTEAGALTLNTGSIGGDGTINAVEQAGGVNVTGTADPGATVTVVMGGVTHTAVANGSGVWTTTYSKSEIASGDYSSTVKATVTDAAGNSRSVEGTVQVDTRVDNFGIDTMGTATAGDGSEVINAAVKSAGFGVTGTAEPGSSVIVTLGGVSRTANVDASGNWSVNFKSGEIPAGEYDATLTVDATDAAGNTATLSETVRVDTRVNALEMNGPVEGDDVVNVAEAADGVTLSGSVEPGSSVTVEMFGKSYAATVNGAGNWSVDIPAGDIPKTEGSAGIKVTATDNAGNSRSVTETVTIDTIAPEDPDIVGYFRQGGGYRSVTLETSDDDVSVHQVNPGGTVEEVGLHAQENAFLGETDYYFLNEFGSPQTVPDGSQLVVTSTDDAGNTASTFVVLDETTTTTVDIANPNLNAFDIETIDLRFGDQSELTITEAQIEALSDNTDTVTVRGGTDDTVTITGATASGQTTVDGETYDVYTLGDDATIIIDEDIDVVT